MNTSVLFFNKPGSWSLKVCGNCEGVGVCVYVCVCVCVWGGGGGG